MKREEALIKVFRNTGRKKITAETLGILSGMSRWDVNEKLRRMEKFGIVRPAEKQRIRFWELLEE